MNAADEIIRGDDVIDLRSVDIEDRCFHLLALQQPMASDLRAIITAVKLVGEIERSGDLVVNICKASRRLYGRHSFDPKIRGLITRMSSEAQQLFRRALDAYVEGDAALAAALDDMDDILDQLHDDLIQAIFESHSSGRLDLQAAVQLAVVARFYERIGDHAVNIAERVHYMVTGGHPEVRTGTRGRVERAGPRRRGRDAEVFTGELNFVWVVAVAGVVVALGNCSLLRVPGAAGLCAGRHLGVAARRGGPGAVAPR